jgi:acetylornithine aminotransferase
MSLLDNEAQLFFKTYKRLTLDVDRGDGCYLYTRDGRKYLDMFSGLAVNALGYNHPGIIAAIENQIKKYIHLSNFFVQEPQVDLAERLLRLSKFQRLFFTNSGTEAIEGTIKLVRKWGKAKKKTTIFGMSNGFSGRTMGSLSIMDKEKYREGYGPFLENCGHVEFNDVDDLRKKVDDATAAVFLEFIQGEGGVVPVSAEFVTALQSLREKHGFLIVADEIQSGIFRTGMLFAFQHYKFTPDIVTIAKPIGGGLPLGAILGNEKVANVWTHGVHGTTFGGNPVACAAGIAVIDALTTNRMAGRINEASKYLFAQLDLLKSRFPVIKEVRGFGFMVGVELTVESGPLVDAMLEDGVLVNSTAGTVVRILPPLIAGKEEIDILLASFERVLANHGQK